MSQSEGPLVLHADVIPVADFVLAMFILEGDVNFVFEQAAWRALCDGGAAMNSVYRSILARSLMTGVASLAVMAMGPAGVRAEIVIVQGDDGAAGDPGEPGGNGEPVAADAGSTHPITAPLNTATASGGSGGQGGNGGNGGNGGAASATAATAVISGSAAAGANSSGGQGGNGGNNRNGGNGGAANAAAATTLISGSAAAGANSSGGNGGDGNNGVGNGGNGGAANGMAATSSGSGGIIGYERDGRAGRDRRRWGHRRRGRGKQ